MSKNFEELLLLLQSVLDERIKVRLSGVANSAKIDPGMPVETWVGQILPTLKARQENARKTRKEIFGLHGLIGILESLASNTVVLEYGVTADHFVGNVYIGKDGTPFGAAFVCV
jgi:hypothetical protein